MLDAGAHLDAVDDAAFHQVFKSPSKMLRTYAVHGGAEAASVVESDDLFAFRGEAAGEAGDQVNLGSDGEYGAGGGVLNNLDEALGGAQCVGLLVDLPVALRMHDDLDAGILGADLVDVAGEKALMNGAVAIPQNDAAGGEGFLRLAAAVRAELHGPRIPYGHLVKGDAHGVPGVAAEMLFGEEEDALTTRESPFKGGAGVGRGANQAAIFAAKGFDGGSGVHVRDGHDFAGEAQALERIPAVLHLGNFGHIGHRASGVEVGQDYLLAVVAEHVGAFGHEVDAAEDDVLRICLRGDFGELVAVAGEVGEADDLVALVVVAEQNSGRAQFGARGCDSLVHGVVRKRQVVFEGACVNGLRRGRRLFVNYQVHFNPPSALHILFGDGGRGC